MPAESNNVRHVPEDYGTITPFLIVRGVAQFLEFLGEAFGANERGRVSNDDGITIGHAEVWIGDSVVMMFDALEGWPETPSFLALYVEDCDTIHRQALKAGATEVTKLSTNAWGDRGSCIRDPFGNVWWIQNHMEDVSEEEIARRMQQEEYIYDMRESAVTLDRELRSRG